MDSLIPYFVDRMTDLATLMDPFSAQYLALIVFAYLTATLEEVCG